MHACMYVCMVTTALLSPVKAGAHTISRRRMYVRMYVCMYVCMHGDYRTAFTGAYTISRRRMYVCMYVCMHACMYVCMVTTALLSQGSTLSTSRMYVCTCLYILYTCTYTYIDGDLLYVCMYTCMYVVGTRNDTEPEVLESRFTHACMHVCIGKIYSRIRSKRLLV
jgi:hypothetical protein